jgi:hypothetical protein
MSATRCGAWREARKPRHRDKRGDCEGTKRSSSACTGTTNVKKATRCVPGPIFSLCRERAPCIAVLRRLVLARGIDDCRERGSGPGDLDGQANSAHSFRAEMAAEDRLRYQHSHYRSSARTRCRCSASAAGALQSSRGAEQVGAQCSRRGQSRRTSADTSAQGRQAQDVPACSAAVIWSLSSRFGIVTLVVSQARCCSVGA